MPPLPPPVADGIPPDPLPTVVDRLLALVQRQEEQIHALQAIVEALL